MSLARASVPPIYALTDPSAGSDRVDTVAQLVSAGIQWIQIREKSLTDIEFYRVVDRVMASLPAKVRLFVNDRADLALACAADGVHLGAEDLTPAAARAVAAERPLIIGYSTHSIEEAVAAADDPAVDYVAIGPIFRSRTKDVREPLGPGVLRRLRQHTEKPIVAIGGIDAGNIGEVLSAGADSAALVAALYGGAPVVENARRILDAVERSR